MSITLSRPTPPPSQNKMPYADSPPKGLLSRVWGFFTSLSLAGLILGAALLCVSLIPMLLPRTWSLQAIGSGISLALGYGMGRALVLLADGYCHLTKRPLIRWLQPYRMWIVGLLLLMASGFTVYHWQLSNRMRELMSMDSQSLLMSLTSVLVGGVLWLVIVMLARGVALLANWLVNLLSPRFHVAMRIVEWSVVTLLLVSLLVEASRNYIWQPLLQRVSQSASELDRSDPKQLDAPTSPLKSGFDDSQYPAAAAPAQTWQQLGHYGQRFVSLGLSADQITAVTGRPAMEPIRVFVGLDNQDSSPELILKSVDLAMSELERTGAWQRQYLVVHGATGRGWVEEYSSLGSEYMTDGDIATVSVQYSYLPSQVSFLVDRQVSSMAYIALLNAIEDKRNSLPKASRPKLMLAGESLGAFATQSAFIDEADLVQRIDGAVWVGTPRLSSLWTHLVSRRAAGTAEVLPIVSGGRHIRFMDRKDSLTPAGHPQGALLSQVWESPRMVFVQYASDPIVWWSPKMLWRAPDWMTEPAGRNVLRVPSWWSGMSLWELTLDMAASDEAPAGHGHTYKYDTLDAWQAVLGVPADTDKIGQAIDARLRALVAEHDEDS